MIKSKYLLGGILVLVIIGIVILNSYIQRGNQKEDQEKDFKEAGEKYMAPTNTGVKLVPELVATHETGIPYEIKSQHMSFSGMDITAGQEWNKNTKLKCCIRYKSNTESSDYRNAILYANSSLENGYNFQIDIYERKTDDYHCGSWANAKGIIAKAKSRGTYRIIIPFKSLPSDENAFHEICVDDINSQLNYCASEWGINEDDAYITNIHKVYMASPSKSLDDYTTFDYFKIFVNGSQVSGVLFPNQDFNKFSGLMDDDNPDDFMGWKKYKNAYATSVLE